MAKGLSLQRVGELKEELRGRVDRVKGLRRAMMNGNVSGCCFGIFVEKHKKINKI